MRPRSAPAAGLQAAGLGPGVTAMNARFKHVVGANGQVLYRSTYEVLSASHDDLHDDAGSHHSEATKAGRTHDLVAGWRAWFTRKRVTTLTTLLAIFAVLAVLCAWGSALQRNRTKVVRTINFSFDSTEPAAPNATQAMLVAEQRYETLDPSVLYYEDDAGFDFTVHIYLVRDVSKPQDRDLLVKFIEDKAHTGGLQDGQMFYLSRSRRVLCMYRGEPAILFLPSLRDATEVNRHWHSIITITKLEESVVSRLFPDRHKYPYSLIRRRPLVPSPTMRLAASAVTMVGVDEVDSKGKPLSHSVKHYSTGVTFYNMQSGRFEGAARLHTKSDQTDMHLAPAVANRSEPEYLLWSKDSSGVFMLYTDEAFFIEATPPYTVHAVTMVPQYPVPTHGGAVAHSGWAAYIRFAGNEGTLQLKHMPDWVPFNDVPLVPFGTQTYTTAGALE